MKIVAFTGFMGSGKSTAIKFLRELLNYQTVNVKFAAPLYDIQELIYRRISGAYERPADFVKDRKLLQWLGTDWGRNTISDTLWVDLWKHQVGLVKNLQKNVKVITCDDARFDNEAEAVKAIGGIVVKITRKNANPEGGQGITKHASEQGISESLIDFTIENNGSYLDLGEQINKLFASL